MHLRHVLPFLALFAWQVTPPDGPPDRPSRFRLWLGAGGRSFDYSYWGTAGGDRCLEYAECACARYTPTYAKRYDGHARAGSAAVHLDAWPAPRVRVSGAFGSAGSGTAPFVAGLVAWEGKLVGLGAGWARPSGLADRQGLAAFLRFGPEGSGHLRAELRNPTSTPGVTGWMRAGLVARPGGPRSTASLFFGVSAVEGGPDTTYASLPGTNLARRTRQAFFADIVVPVNRDTDIFARAHVATKARGIAFGVALRGGAR